MINVEGTVSGRFQSNHPNLQRMLRKGAKIMDGRESVSKTLEMYEWSQILSALVENDEADTNLYQKIDDIVDNNFDDEEEITIDLEADENRKVEELYPLSIGR